MPKVQKAPAGPRSTRYNRERFDRILAEDVTMPTPCGRCKEKGLRCVVELSTGFCAYCIRAQVRCDLVLTNTEYRELKEEQRQARLDIARLEAQLAARRLALLESEEKERLRVLASIASNRELEQLEVAAGIRDPTPPASPSGGTVSTVVPLPLQPESSTDFGWLQGDFLPSFDPSLSYDPFAFLELPDALPLDAGGGIRSPSPGSSPSSASTPRYSGCLAILAI